MAAVDMRNEHFWLPNDFPLNTQRKSSNKHHHKSVAAATEDLHPFSNSSQQPTNEYDSGNTQRILEELGTVTLSQQSAKDVERENRVIRSDLERDMLPAFEKEDLLPTANLDSPPSQRHKHEPIHHLRDPDLNCTTPSSGGEETGHGFSTL
jgi:aromatic ring hydroxylase